MSRLAVLVSVALLSGWPTGSVHAAGSGAEPDGGEEADGDAGRDEVRRQGILRVLQADPPEGGAGLDARIDERIRAYGRSDAAFDGGESTAVRVGPFRVATDGHAHAGSGRVDWEGLRTKAAERTSAVAACVEAAEASGRVAEGTFGVQIVFTEHGMVREVSVIGPAGSNDGVPHPPSVRGADFASCIRSEVAHWEVADYVPGSGPEPADGMLARPFGGTGPLGADVVNTNRFTQQYSVTRYAACGPAGSAGVGRGPRQDVRCAVVDTGAPPEATPPRRAIRLQLVRATSAEEDDEAAHAVVRRGQQRLQACFRRHDDSAAEAASGRMVVRMEVGANGRVSEVHLDLGADSAAAESELETCLVREIGRWRFRPRDEGPFTLHVVWALQGER